MMYGMDLFEDPLQIGSGPSWDERVRAACELLRRQRYGWDPGVSVEWHEPGELPGNPVCTITIKTPKP